MKKTKILFLLTLFISFCFFSNVKAVDMNGWAVDVKMPTKVVFKTCEAMNKNCTTTIDARQYPVNISSSGASTQITVVNGIQSSNSISGSKYFMVMHTLDTFLMKDYAYVITGYYCATSSKASVENISTDYDQAGTGSFSHPVADKLFLENNTISNYTFDNTGSMSGTCNALSYYFVPSINSQYFGWELFNYSGNNAYYTFLGYNIENLGPADQLTAGDVSIKIDEALSNSNLATADSIEEVQESINRLSEELSSVNDSITSEDSSQATGEAGSFFSGFTTDTFGLTSVITAPLNLISSITSSSCTPLHLQIPFVNKNLNLPCLTSIYEEFFGSFLDIYQTITFGICAYWVCVKIFNLVKDFKNPDHDEIEVLEL